MSKDKKKIYKPSIISGFPEWLPEVRMVEQRWMDIIRAKFESYGFASIETPAVEELNVIAAKGEDVDKEIYVIERLQKDEDDDKEARLALHFDQTVPFARYAAQHFNDLVFPFKRYQMQKVWRGERPQAGRMREFYQCDIDVVNPDNLSINFDGEMPAIIWDIFSTLPCFDPVEEQTKTLTELENIQIRISNRKILLGLLEYLSIEDPVQVTRIIDKIEKIGAQAASNLLQKQCDLSEAQIEQIFSTIGCHPDRSEGSHKILRYTLNGLKEITGLNDMMSEGIEELCAVLDSLSHLPKDAVVADLSIVRGLDYYTGTVYETVFVDDPGYGSICSGGRYDDLAGSYINKHLPGVGISIGFSRLFDRLRTQGKLPVKRKCPTDILILPPRNAEDLPAMRALEQTLRTKRGFNIEIATGKKLQKQMAYAEKKGIPYVWFAEDGEVKNMETSEQVKADPNTWETS